MTISTISCAAVLLLGASAGLLSSSLGVGAGVIVVPALVLLLDCGQKSAQGMALALMVPMALLGAIQYSRTPGVQMQWVLITLMIVGSIAGVLIGARLMAHVPESWLRRAFAILLMVVAVRMLWPAQAKPETRKPPSPASLPGDAMP